VRNPLGYDEALPWSQFDGLTLEINEKVPVENEEEFIIAIVLMPVILSLQYAKPDDGVVHFAKGLVVPPVGARPNQCGNIDYAQGRKLDIEVRCVRIGLRFAQDAFPPKGCLTAIDRAPDSAKRRIWLAVEATTRSASGEVRSRTLTSASRWPRRVAA